MAKFCEICGKGIMSGNKVSHSNRKSRRTWAPNIQPARVLVNGTPRGGHLHPLALRSGKVERVR